MGLDYHNPNIIGPFEYEGLTIDVITKMRHGWTSSWHVVARFPSGTTIDFFAGLSTEVQYFIDCTIKAYAEGKKEAGA